MTEPTPPSTSGTPAPSQGPGYPPPDWSFVPSGGVPAPIPQPAYPMPQQQGSFKRGFGLGSGAALGAGLIFLVLGLLGSLVTTLMFAGALAAVGDRTFTVDQPLETIWGPDAAKHTLRAIDISGVIMATGSDGLALSASTYGYEVADVIDAIKTDDADGLVLLMNTPGGSINGSRAIAEAIERYQDRTGHKVLAYVEGMSASGGMYAMAGADRILADHGTLVGSIGVIAGPFDHYKGVTAITGSLLVSGVVTSEGITSEYLTQGKGKDFGNPFREMTKEERTVFTTGMANEYADFVDWVSQKRDIPVATIRNDLGAYIYDPKTAREKGLIDDVAGRNDAFREAAELNGTPADDTRIVRATLPSVLDQLLGAEARVHGYGAAAERATSNVCTGTPSVLAYAGSITAICG